MVSWPEPRRQELRRQLAEWLARQSIPSVPHDFVQGVEVLRGWQHRLYDAGWLGVGWPEDYGGRGGGPLDRLAVFEELVKANAPQPFGHVGLEVIGPTILRFGTENQKATLLPPLLRGDHVWCQGFSEPDAG